MGKLSHKSSGNYDDERHQNMDKHNVGNKSGNAKQRRIRGTSDIDSCGSLADDSGGIYSGFVSVDDDSLFEHLDIVRGVDNDGDGVHRGETCEVRRTFDPVELALIIAAAVPGNVPDMTPVVANENNVILVCSGGALVFVSIGNSLYEIMEVWRLNVSTEYVQTATLQSLCWMFTHTDCTNIVRKTPVVSLIARDPLIIDATTAVLQIMNDRTFKVLKTR
jgi:hypothetical protein